jgi:hypothetical protein
LKSKQLKGGQKNEQQNGMNKKEKVKPRNEALREQRREKRSNLQPKSSDQITALNNSKPDKGKKRPITAKNAKNKKKKHFNKKHVSTNSKNNIKLKLN